MLGVCRSGERSASKREDLSVGEPPSEIVRIGRARRQLDAEGRLRLAAGLHSIARAIERDDLEAGRPFGVAVVILTDELPSAWVQGLVDRDDVMALHRSFSAIGGGFFRPKDAEPKTFEQIVQEAHRRHLAYEAQRRLDQQAAMEASPWSCEYCRRRFKTERGAKQHQAGNAT